LKSAAPNNVTFLGALPRPEIFLEMTRARAVVVPSLWYEGFPMVVVEAFAHGTAVIASKLGALAEVVEDGVTGRLVPAGDVELWRQELTSVSYDLAFSERAGRAARETFLRLYTPAENLRQLEAIYARSIDRRSIKRAAS
jgi:glycosyltransferase involved in cell wall biosynthesis